MLSLFGLHAKNTRETVVAKGSLQRCRSARRAAHACKTRVYGVRTPQDTVLCPVTCLRPHERLKCPRLTAAGDVCHKMWFAQATGRQSAQHRLCAPHVNAAVKHLFGRSAEWFCHLFVSTHLLHSNEVKPCEIQPSAGDRKSGQRFNCRCKQATLHLLA